MWCVPLLAALAHLATACYTPPEPRRFAAALLVVDESGAPVAGARVDLGHTTHTTDARGRVSLTGLEGPVLAVVEAQGFLAEPVPVGRADADRTVRLRLLSDLGGRRWVMHSGGDVMLGRGYEAPAQGEPLLPASDIAGGARHVVAPLARAFAAADLRTVNLETVVSELPAAAAYPGKEVVLRSRPGAMAGLQALGVDLAVMANDHARDYLDEGIAATMAALDAAGIHHVGASADASPADTPWVLDVGGTRVGVLAWTTLTGSSINDRFPEDGDPVPSPLPAADAWQYEARDWGFQGPTWSVPARERRIGSAWRLFADAEPDLSPDEAADAWHALVDVYPELQDWVARRGHGGAAGWAQARATRAIAELATRAQMVVVQLHAGFAGQPAPSALVRQMARDAIDAGADIVIGHHPQVLQGAEWYRDRLIVYSLGNLVFDETDRERTPGAFLRTVWDGAALVEARLFLFELDGYRPLPVTDAAARRTARILWERSRLAAQVEAVDGGRLRIVATNLDPFTAPASVHLRHHDAVLERAAPAADELALDVEAGAVVPLGYEGLVFPGIAGPGRSGSRPGDEVWLGRDLVGWGSFEDQLADGALRDDTGWHVNSSSEEIRVDEDAAAGIGYLRLRRKASHTQSVMVDQVAPMDLPAHRLYTSQGGTTVPADGAPRYSLRMLARLVGGGGPVVRFALHHPQRGNAFAELPLDLPADGSWHQLDLPLPEETLSFPGTRTQPPTPAAAVTLALRLLPPERGRSTHLDVDELALIEWRRAADLPAHFGAYDFVHNAGGAGQRVVLSGLPLRPTRAPE